MENNGVGLKIKAWSTIKALVFRVGSGMTNSFVFHLPSKNPVIREYTILFLIKNHNILTICMLPQQCRVSECKKMSPKRIGNGVKSSKGGNSIYAYPAGGWVEAKSKGSRARIKVSHVRR